MVLTERVRGRAVRPAQLTVLLLVFWLVVGPRVELATFAGSSIRLEDALLGVLAVVGIAQWRLVKPLLAKQSGIALVAVVSLAAAVLGSVLHTVSSGASVLYAIRPLEYWFALPAVTWALVAGGSSARRLLIRLLAVATVVQSAVAAGQYLFGFDIGFSAFTLERGAGLTNGPYELGAIMSVLVCFWIHERRPLLVALAGAGLLMSLSRISIIGALLGLAFIAGAAVWRRSKQGGSRRSAPTPGGVVVAATLVIGAILATPVLTERIVTPALERAQGTSIVASWESAGQVAAVTPEARNSEEYAAVAYGAIHATILDRVTTSDASNEVRFYRWHLLLNDLSASPLRWFAGLGPSFAGPSVDGAYLRILVEAGFLGALVWARMIVRWFRSVESWFRGATIALLVGNVFIDLFYAERPMVVFWVLLALTATRMLDVKGIAERPKESELPRVG